MQDIEGPRVAGAVVVVVQQDADRNLLLPVPIEAAEGSDRNSETVVVREFVEQDARLRGELDDSVDRARGREIFRLSRSMTKSTKYPVKLVQLSTPTN
jgi:hypothetical protein